MFDQFYKFIAKRLIDYFSSTNLVKPGERFLLRLDSEEMVKKVSETLKETAIQHGIEGTFNFENIFETYTLKVSGTQIVVVPKLNGIITDDFLATLRNSNLGGNNYPILIIAEATIDTISSGAQDLSAAGMPFYSKSIFSYLEHAIEGFGHSKVDQALLSFDLESKNQDRFSDRTSISEYSHLLSVIDKGQLEKDDYPELGFFPITQGIEDNKIKKTIKEDRDLFSRIQRAVQNNDLEGLDKYFNKKLKDKIEDNQDNEKKWYADLSFEWVKEQIKAGENTKNAVRFDFDSISVSGLRNEEEIPLIEDEDYLIVQEGKNKADLFIFNPDKSKKIMLSVKTSRKLGHPVVLPNNSEFDFSIENREFSIVVDAKGCSFYTITSENKGSSELKICILNISLKSFYDPDQKYSLRVSKTGKSDWVIVKIDGSDFYFNKEAEGTKIIVQGGSDENITIDYQQPLEITYDDDVLAEKPSRFRLSVGGVTIPIEVRAGKEKRPELTGLDILREKLEKKKGFQIQNGYLVRSVQQFRLKTGSDFINLLDMEQKLITDQLPAAKLTDGELEKIENFDIPEEVLSQYLRMLDEFEKRNTTPSLCFYDPKLVEVIQNLICLVEHELKNIQIKSPLPNSINSLLLLGAIIDEDSHRILMSPLSPLNLLYQLKLQQQSIGEISDDLFKLLTPLNMVPYIYSSYNWSERQLFTAVEQEDSPEWRVYSSLSQYESLESRYYIRKIIRSKIEQFREHFPFLFQLIGNDKMIINLLQMDSCKEAFDGIAEYYARFLSGKQRPDEVLSFRINIYKDDKNRETAFNRLFDKDRLYHYLESEEFGQKIDYLELCTLMISKIEIYEYETSNHPEFEYCHLMFYEMAPSKQIGSQQMNSMPTGISLNGFLSGVSSAIKEGSEWYTTGFGTKYAPDDDLVNLARNYNAAYNVAFSGSDYDPDICINTQVKANQNSLLSSMYDSSNWVVFINPRVDLDFFEKNPSNRSIMVIHYSDQLSAASGYDDITVTAKSEQYIQSIQEYLKSTDNKNVADIIQLFNAVNGDWLLRLNSSPFSSGRGYFTKEKLSILSAIRLLMVYFRENSQTVWVPMSLEELLRVSGNVGLSRQNGKLSAKNLGFEHGPTCDDILMVGFTETDGYINVAFHPVEVKIGENSSTYISKAVEQTVNTSKGLTNALFPENDEETLSVLLTRTFFFQQVLLAAEKMQVFNICPEIKWPDITEKFREKILNNKIRYDEELNKTYGIGSVISFKQEAMDIFQEFTTRPIDDADSKVSIGILTLPKKKGISYLTDSYEKISEELLEYHVINSTVPGETVTDFTDEQSLKDNADKNDEGQTDPVNNKTEIIEQPGTGTDYERRSDQEIKPTVKSLVTPVEHREPETKAEENQQELPGNLGMEIKFGTDLSTGTPLFWYPNNSEQVFNFNTGVIGTSGTGKTQFVKSIITQLIQQKTANFDNPEFGILIFDYKGDYNESKKDFVEAVDPHIFKLEDLPFNPFALVQTSTYKPRLPLHTADGFIETISRVYKLGAIQKNNLKKAILSAYEDRGIDAGDRTTWDKTPPTFYDVYRNYQDDESIKKNDSLDSALSYLYDYHVFEENSKKTVSLYDLIKGVTVIDLQGYTPELQNLIVALALDSFYLQMQSHGSSRIDGKFREITKLILVDEADNFMSQDFPSLKKILKEGREFGVGIILSTQFMSHFDQSEDQYAKYIFTWVVHAMSGAKSSEIDLVFKLPPKSLTGQKIMADIPKLEKFHSIVQIGNESPCYIHDYPFFQLMLDKKTQN